MNSAGEAIQGNGSSVAIRSRVDAAFKQLESIGFKLPGDFAFAFEYAATQFNSRTLYTVFALGSILTDEQPITVRGTFYRAVSAGIYPDTSDAYYDACKERILDMRRAGLIPYHWISDSTRRRLKPSSWSGLDDYAETVAQAYRKDLWERQEDYLEIFVEKDAMAGVIEPITNQYDITLNVIRGNCSETFIYRVAELWKQIEKPIHVYYLGDHDPNGLKIEEDLRKRLQSFANQLFDWQRLAITNEDFANNELIGFPVKRNTKQPNGYWRSYLVEFGDRCVEVDAIPSSEIRDRIEEAILSHVDKREWELLKAQEAREKEAIRSGFGVFKDPTRHRQ